MNERGWSGRLVEVGPWLVAMLTAWWVNIAVLEQALIAAMGIDIASGVLVAIGLRQLKSDTSLKGCTKKAMILLLVVMAELLEHVAAGVAHTGNLPIGEAIAAYYLAHEGLSILENAARLGLPVPRVLRDSMVKLSPEQPGEPEP